MTRYKLDHKPKKTELLTQIEHLSIILRAPENGYLYNYQFSHKSPHIRY